ncbi:hypothetical protein [Halorussus halobius]|uniref:hypothetical protein n=1 Tax=Halorussus halobius TaxID=1710537 RepID=UPI001091E2A7|nr:hypothetical protein [Halorussus halobius]
MAFEHATGRSLDAIDPSEYDEDAEERISILHKRGREYVLNLAPENPYTECLNRQYDCGHVAYGPPRELPSTCPECQPVATDGGRVGTWCSHPRTRRYGRTDLRGRAVIEERCTLCGATVSMDGGTR